MEFNKKELISPEKNSLYCASMCLMNFLSYNYTAVSYSGFPYFYKWMNWIKGREIFEHDDSILYISFSAHYLEDVG